MNKKEYFGSLEEVVQDASCITYRKDELAKQIQMNHWSISIDSVTAQSVEAGDVIFFREGKEKSSRPIKLSTVNADLMYYLWFDDQAGNLNFNFINSSHQSLPFNSGVEIVKTELLIAEAFLKSKYINGIEREELEDFDNFRAGISTVYQVKVYTEV